MTDDKFDIEELERLWQEWERLTSTPGSHFSDVYRAELAWNTTIRKAIPRLLVRLKELNGIEEMMFTQAEGMLRFKRENQKLLEENDSLRARIAELESEVKSGAALVAKVGDTNRELENRIAELEGQAKADEEMMKRAIEMFGANCKIYIKQHLVARSGGGKQ